MKPNCYRRNLIEYYSHPEDFAENPTRISLSKGKRKSNLSTEEQELMEILTELGVGEQVQRNLRVGPHSIGWALVGPNGKRGIEWDGGNSSSEESLRQHLTLQRAGWEFFRIQRLEWLYDRKRVVERLKGWL